MIKQTLPPHQLCVAVYIHAYQEMNDNMPTIAEIASSFGVAPNAAHETVRRLIKIGVFEESENPRKFRFARTDTGAAYRKQIVAKRLEQSGK